MKQIIVIIGLLSILTACGSSRKSLPATQNLPVTEKDPLTYEQRRKYDYYFLEAVRMKQKGEYDAAFELSATVWTFIPARQPRCTKYLNFTWYWDKRKRANRH